MTDIKSIARGDYLEDAIKFFTKAKINHPAIQKVLVVAKAVINTLVVFIILAPLAIVAKPLIGIALTCSFAAFLACVVLNLQQKTLAQKIVGSTQGTADLIRGLTR